MITSERLTPPEMTSRLLIEPDEARFRGSQFPERDLPRHHMWELVARDGGQRVDIQIEGLLERVSGKATEIRSLVDDGCVMSFLVGRHFNDPDGAEEFHELVYSEAGSELTVLPGQHQLLGWVLEGPVLRFMADAGIVLDIDEYG